MKSEKLIDFSDFIRYNYSSCSRGVSGALYLQSAIVGVILHGGLVLVKLPQVSGIETWVLRDRNL